jgi:Holliday junction resolvase
VKFDVDPSSGFAVLAASPDTTLRIGDVIAGRKHVIVAVEMLGEIVSDRHWIVVRMR